MDKQTLGLINGIISGISFGLIPLFSIPVIAAGMGNVSILVYRFFFGSLAMLGMLLLKKTDLRVSLSELCRIAILSLFYIGTALATLECYHYLSSGIATALVYTDPIWCAIIGLIFLGDRFSLKLTSSCLFATLGVMMMTGVFTEDGTFSALGLFWGLLSGLSYALYLIFVPRLRLKRIPSLKLTFYVFFIGMLILAAYAILKEGNIEIVTNPTCWTNLILLGLIPTALSNICVTMSLRLVDSTIVAILGAFEPLTAMVIGIVILGDSWSIMSLGGTFLILLAVAMLTILPKINN
ncbi:MAG: DMT family transporter [Prevotella sp.]|nr:DMT family transporter [Prevotella sp.]MDY4498379.1 DMT family transporter [Prevotella sp.]